MSVLTLLLSVLSAGIGYGFVGGADIEFVFKVICGFVFIGTPVCVSHLLVLIWKKES